MVEKQTYLKGRLGYKSMKFIDRVNDDINLLTLKKELKAIYQQQMNIMSSILYSINLIDLICDSSEEGSNNE